jgi:hypothetical protein
VLRKNLKTDLDSHQTKQESLIIFLIRSAVTTRGKKSTMFGRVAFGRVSFGRGSFSCMSFGRMVIWTRGHLVARSYGRKVIWSQDHFVARSFSREHLVVSAWSRVT